MSGGPLNEDVFGEHLEQGPHAAKMQIIRAISARTLSPVGVSVTIESGRSRASAAVRTGVLPFLTECFGPRTALAGFTGRIWPTTSQSKSIRLPARWSLTEGADIRSCGCASS